MVSVTHSPNTFLGSRRSFLTISKLILTFEGELRYLKTTFILVISEHSEPGVTLVAQVLAGVERKEVCDGSREAVPFNPRAALVGAELAVRGSGLKREQIMSMSQKYQKQTEKLSDSH